MCNNSAVVKSLKFVWDTSKLTSGGGWVYRGIDGVYGSWLSLNGCVLFLAASSDYGFQMCKCCLFWTWEWNALDGTETNKSFSGLRVTCSAVFYALCCSNKAVYLLILLDSHFSLFKGSWSSPSIHHVEVCVHFEFFQFLVSCGLCRLFCII